MLGQRPSPLIEHAARHRPGRDHELERRRGRRRIGEQERPYLFDRQFTRRLDLELQVKKNVRAAVVPRVDREVLVDLPHELAELAELGVGQDVIAAREKR